MDESIVDLMFQNELNQPVIKVERAALSFARSIAYPRLDIPFYLKQMDALAEEARPQVDCARSLAEKVDALSDFLYAQKGFHGNRTHYYDPRNSYLNCVLDRKAGIPITLAVIYVAVAQRLGMHAYGIGLPGHFIAGVYENGAEVMVDPFHAGARITPADCARLVRDHSDHQGAFDPKWLKPVSPLTLLARMLTNLCNAYVQSEDWPSAIPVIQHLLLVQPNTNFHLRDLGYLYLYNGSMRLSAQYLEAYLQRTPDAPDYENVRSSLEIVTGRLALWN